jgi:hypothetical protein
MLSGQLQGGYRQDTLGLGREGEADLAAHLTTGLGDKRPIRMPKARDLESV